MHRPIAVSDASASAGSLFFTHVDNGSYCGVILGQKEHEPSMARVLILGFRPKSPVVICDLDVMNVPVQQFPWITEFPIHLIFPDDFDLVFRHHLHDGDGYSTQVSHAHTAVDFMETMFGVTQTRTIFYLYVARRVLERRPIEHLGHHIPLDHVDKLLLWATLYVYFPDKVEQPPAVYEFHRELNGVERYGIWVNENTKHVRVVRQ